ncbi:MAG: anti-sigma F factor antagonist [Candidatus Anoxymicrobium japonicum]|uniref:Anti-sigma factor antagonist n=1 Tax=Candidatus Anoxymicrobium japonicum TaxID=2013648 RepID=A0A2N3G4J9_9ACTN|nr:MAG: anti-sigma F factor antagonist [Candidatus Anoxymicrobium japonicum]
MEIEVEEKEGYHVVAPVGELDVYTIPLFRKVVLKLEGERARDLILDLTRVTFIDSSGLGSLIETYQKVKAVDGELAYVIDNPRVLKILSLVNLDKVFRVFSNLGQALQDVGVTGGYVDEEFFSDLT